MQNKPVPSRIGGSDETALTAGEKSHWALKMIENSVTIKSHDLDAVEVGKTNCSLLR